MFSKKSNVFQILLFVSFILVIIGSFLDRSSMKLVVLLLIIIAIIGIIFGNQRNKFLSENELKLSSANAVSKAFLFMIVYFCMAFIVNIFLSPIPNQDFAVVGAMFLALFLVKLSTLKDIESYLGMK
ncbi:MAG: hypothetical protein AABX38_04985 [Candidatus Micrarchaeota archaeon]